jgi:PIN domain nuclease of toxin-antitoxin system
VTRLLLDTHAFLWWITDAPALSGVARRAILDEDSEIYVSAASAWEIATKHRIGKLPSAAALAADVAAAVAGAQFVGLPVTLAHAQKAGTLPGPHRDPFDRMLIAQAVLDDLVLVSNEAAFDAYGARRLW